MSGAVSVFIAPARTRIGHSTNVIGRLLLPPLAALALAAGSAAATTPASAFTTIRACLTKAGAAHVKPGHTNRATFPGRYRRVTWSYVTSSAGVVGVIWTASGVTHRELAATRACFAPFS